MNEVLSVLFLGGAKRVSLATYLIEEGKKRNIEVRIFSYELSGQVPIAAVGEVIIGKRWKDADLDSHLSTIIKDRNIRMILPFVDPAIEVASRLKKVHPEVFIPCSSIELCRTMFDKQLSNDWFREHGIPVPRYFRNIREIELPVICKPRTGSASKGIKIILEKEELNTLSSPENYLIQEYLSDNEEYTVDCYVDCHGRILTVVPRIRLEVAGGEVMTSRTVRDEVLIGLSKKILMADAFRGPVTIQFIRNKQTGDTYVMEINPRLGGGVIAAIAAGGNMPAFLLDECEGKQPAAVEDWRENTLMTRYFKEVIFYADNH